MCVCLRHNRPWELDYMDNLKQFFKQLKSILPKESLVIWTLTMPVGNNIRGGFLVPEVNTRAYACTHTHLLTHVHIRTQEVRSLQRVINISLIV